MKLLLLFLLTLSATHASSESDTVILDEMGVNNLRIETVEAAETDFEETLFTLGRIDHSCGSHSVLTSRIAGRIIEVGIHEGEVAKKGEILACVESRQTGDPPAIIELKAPADGLVLSSKVHLGAPVEPSMELMEIFDLSSVWAIARVPEPMAAKLAPGSKARIRVSALGDEMLEGELIRFGTSADRESGTIDAIFTIANPGLKMRPGMRAEFSIILSQRSNVIGIPRAALQGDASKRFVYVKHFDLPNAFIKTSVQIGEMNDRMVEVVSGLFPADEVVTKGAYSLSFAGGGSGVSLKEALDAAHGHEHAEDGGELTPEKKAEMEAKKRADSGLPPATPGGGSSPVWMVASGVLFLLLLASLFSRKFQTLSES
jgi:membrane fusion protein, heavy metal efflux system